MRCNCASGYGYSRVFQGPRDEIRRCWTRHFPRLESYGCRPISLPACTSTVCVDLVDDRLIFISKVYIQQMHGLALDLGRGSKSVVRSERGEGRTGGSARGVGGGTLLDGGVRVE
jgi:hypothetical protein